MRAMDKMYVFGGHLVYWILFLQMLTLAGGHTGGIYDMTCCQYCRSEPSRWIRLGLTFSLSESELSDPAAYLVDDQEQTTVFVQESQDKELNFRYAGAPMKLEYDLELDTSKLIDSQYYQIDLAEPKYVGGLLTQGGFYEETTVGYYPYTESWVTEYAMSVSNSSEGFELVTGDSGDVQTFQGNTDSQGIRINSLSPGIVSRYIRIHPLWGESALGGGAVRSVSLRASGIVCAREPCLNVRINCLLSDWSVWGECACTSRGCHSDRTRSVRRIQACGGERCGSLKESIPCTPPEPTWKSVAQYLGIAAAVVLVVGLVALLVYKKKHRNRVEVIMVTEREEDEDEQEGPVVVPRGEKAKEARRTAARGFEDPSGWDVDPLYGAGDRNPPLQETFTRQLPKPPMFKLHS